MKYKPPKSVNVSLYAAQGRWRWRVETLNGRVIGAATENYHNENDARENLELLTGLVVPPELYGKRHQRFQYRLSDRWRAGPQ